jgi:chromosome condensin MukBEF MukE localization factor
MFIHWLYSTVGIVYGGESVLSVIAYSVYSWGRKVRTGNPGQESEYRKARTGLPGQNSLDRTAWT